VFSPVLYCLKTLFFFYAIYKNFSMLLISICHNHLKEIAYGRKRKEMGETIGIGSAGCGCGCIICCDATSLGTSVTHVVFIAVV
jgi:hypothetical protein